MGVLFPEEAARPVTGPSKYCTTPAFQAAVQEGRFAQTFGLFAVVGSVPLLFGPAILIGLGLLVIGYGKGKFYRILGGILIAAGVLAFGMGLVLPGVGRLTAILGMWTLAGGVIWRSIGIREVLRREGTGDPDFAKTRTRATVGFCTGIAALMLSTV